MQNPIEQKLIELQKHWKEFIGESDHRICCWLIRPDEFQMIELFFELEDSEHGTAPELFIRFETSFSNENKYAFQLVEELKKTIKDFNKNSPKEEQIFFDINQCAKDFPEVDKINPLYFCQQLSSFANSIEYLESAIVAYLLPTSNKNVKNWERWLYKVVEIGIPENVRLMLIDFSEELDEKKELKASPLYKTLSTDFPQSVKIIRPNLDMNAVVQQLATAGNPKHPGTKVNSIFQAMANTSGANRIADIEKLNQKALKLITNQKGEEWQAMEFTTQLLSGSILLGEKDKNIAVKSFDKAIEVAKRITKSGNKAGIQLLAQAQLAKGAALIAAEDPKGAARVYEETALATIDSEKTESQSIESLRMATKCYFDAKQYDLSWKNGRLCLEKMEEVVQDVESKIPSSSTKDKKAALLVRVEQISFSLDSFEDNKLALGKKIKLSKEHLSVLEKRFFELKDRIEISRKQLQPKNN